MIVSICGPVDSFEISDVFLFSKIAIESHMFYLFINSL